MNNRTLVKDLVARARWDRRQARIDRKQGFISLVTWSRGRAAAYMEVARLIQNSDPAKLRNLMKEAA